MRIPFIKLKGGVMYLILHSTCFLFSVIGPLHITEHREGSHNENNPFFSTTTSSSRVTAVE